MSGKNVYYEKRQKSRYKRFVATMSDGTRIQSNDEKEFKALTATHVAKMKGKPKEESKKEIQQPTFDPFTGEPL